MSTEGAPEGTPSASRINEALIRWDWRSYSSTMDYPGQKEAMELGAGTLPWDEEPTPVPPSSFQRPSPMPVPAP